jgi:hypothetical protein
MKASVREETHMEMEPLVDLILLPISLFSGKTLAVSIALLVLGSALALWLVIHFAYVTLTIEGCREPGTRPPPRMVLCKNFVDFADFYIMLRARLEAH